MSSVPFGRLPIDPRTQEPLPPRAQPGYYRSYDVLSQMAFWDAATRKLVLERVGRIPPLRFFSSRDAVLMEAIVDRLIPQDDRDEAHRIPIVPFIDERLTLGRGDGYRYEDMPKDAEAYPLGIQGIELMAQKRWGRPFLELGPTEQDELLKGLHDGKPHPRVSAWDRLPPHRFFLLLIHDAAGIYYAHPWAWNEIGFGGPAYPRGYMRLERGEPEAWEASEKRYAWEPPRSSLSNGFEPLGATEDHAGTGGQEGSH